MMSHQSGFETKARAWQARLDLTLVRAEERTVLKHCRHFGPLRVQRPFYPAGPGECHLYLLHPPGGMVTGDTLDMDIRLRAGAHGLFTTPSAGKVYRGDESTVRQQQRVNCHVDTGALLEWLPQETIVFDGARGSSSLRIDLVESGRFCAWDIVCLGRPASGEKFVVGYFCQDLQVRRDGIPLYIERNRFQGGTSMIDAAWGLQGQPVAGTLIAAVELNQQQRDDCRHRLQALAGSSLIALTAMDGLVVCRYLGSSTAQCRELFTLIWREFKAEYAGIPATIPRIWHT